MSLFRKKLVAEVEPPLELQAQFQELSLADRAALPQSDWDRAGKLVGEQDDIVLVRIATGLFPESRVIWVVTKQGSSLRQPPRSSSRSDQRHRSRHRRRRSSTPAGPHLNPEAV